ncbi:polysaccharide deacetylase [Oryzomicrobium terrae]|uniref:Polysaccharide deacetylase n=1 Tax=Oryzomicrobium terrae TaxID=1735038 RepID=A0A5C1E9H3_9RHOO|nr:polysaccharide deacetylase family protein [Oryzomicrobium terrae]QEL65523.1 polysaccharide deacetylase [Oryzomicrobium terrae]
MSTVFAATPSPRRRPWRPTPLVWLTLAIHLGLLLAVPLGLSWDFWRWGLALFVANHAVLSVTGLWPRSTWLGPNHRRLPAAAAARGEVALTIDDGPDPAVTPRVLDLLDRYQAKATFFCIGTRAAAHPDLVRAIVARGHQVENHSQGHPLHFATLGMGGFAREIGAAQNTLAHLTGRPPRFFRAPAGLRNPFLDPVLARLGLELTAWTRRGFDTRCGDAATVLARLTRGLAAGDILLVHDSNVALDRQGEPVVLAVLPALLDAIRARGLTPVTLDQAFPSSSA